MTNTRVLAVATLAIAASCGGGSRTVPAGTTGTGAPPAVTTKEDVFRAAAAAVTSRSADGLLPLMPTAATIEKWCPSRFAGDPQAREEVTRDLAEAPAKMRERIDACWAAGDLAAATSEVREEGEEPIETCAPELREGSATIVLRTPATEAHLRVRYVRAPDGVYLSREPGCLDDESDEGP